MTNKYIEFTVKVAYESMDGEEVCEESAKNNLHGAIEQMRLNSALTPDNISASSVEVEISRTHEAKLLSMEEAIALFTAELLGNDGVTIEDFVNDHTSHSANYLEDSVWLIDDKQMCSRDLTCLLKQELDNYTGEDILSIFKKYTDFEYIHYQGDSVFIYVPKADA